MKTKSILFTFAAVLIALAGFATGSTKLNVESFGDRKILVSYESEMAYQLELTITGSNGKLLYNLKTQEPTKILQQPVNLSKFGSGKYNVEINFGRQCIRRDVFVKRTTLELGEPKICFKPVFSYENNMLQLSFLNVNRNNVYVNIYKDEEHYNGFSLGKGLDIQKCIDFSMAGKGEYQVVITENATDHFYTVSK